MPTGVGGGSVGTVATFSDSGWAQPASTIAVATMLHAHGKILGRPGIIDTLSAAATGPARPPGPRPG